MIDQDREVVLAEMGVVNVIQGGQRTLDQPYLIFSDIGSRVLMLLLDVSVHLVSTGLF